MSVEHISLSVITWQNIELSLQAILLTVLVDLVPLPLVCVRACVHVCVCVGSGYVCGCNYEVDGECKGT